jgi:RHS repeat-associated protein
VWQYFLGDVRGSTAVAVTKGGVGVQVQWYDPYGAPRGLPAIVGTDRGYLGQYEDTATALGYLNNRYTDPTLGIFLSVDPLVATTSDPYLYANGNPTTLSDPTGLDPDTGAQFRDQAKGNGSCTYSASVSGGNVCGANGVYYGSVSKPPSGAGARNGGSLPTTYYPATSSPACASLGPSADYCSMPVPEQWVPDTTGSPGANADIAALFGKAGLGAMLESVGEAQAWQACGQSLGFGPACDVAEQWSADNLGPEKVDAFASGELIDFVHATAVYGCGTSAGGAAVMCVDSQRLPTFSSDMNRVTYGHYIFCEGRCESARLPHEFVHVRQFEVNGDAMALSYLWQSALNGYRGNPYEVEAYNVGA